MRGTPSKKTKNTVGRPGKLLCKLLAPVVQSGTTRARCQRPATVDGKKRCPLWLEDVAEASADVSARALTKLLAMAKTRKSVGAAMG